MKKLAELFPGSDAHLPTPSVAEIAARHHAFENYDALVELVRTLRCFLKDALRDANIRASIALTAVKEWEEKEE